MLRFWIREATAIAKISYTSGAQDAFDPYMTAGKMVLGLANILFPKAESKGWSLRYEGNENEVYSLLCRERRNDLESRYLGTNYEA